MHKAPGMYENEATVCGGVASWVELMVVEECDRIIIMPRERSI